MRQESAAASSRLGGPGPLSDDQNQSCWQPWGELCPFEASNASVVKYLGGLADGSSPQLAASPPAAALLSKATVMQLYWLVCKGNALAASCTETARLFYVIVASLTCGEPARCVSENEARKLAALVTRPGYGLASSLARNQSSGAAVILRCPILIFIFGGGGTVKPGRAQL